MMPLMIGAAWAQDAVEATGRSDSLGALVFMIPAAICLGGVFVFLFLRAVKGGQFDDLDDPPQRMLKD